MLELYAALGLLLGALLMGLDFIIPHSTITAIDHSIHRAKQQLETTLRQFRRRSRACFTFVWYYNIGSLANYTAIFFLPVGSIIVFLLVLHYTSYLPSGFWYVFTSRLIAITLTWAALLLLVRPALAFAILLAYIVLRIHPIGVAATVLDVDLWFMRPMGSVSSNGQLVYDPLGATLLMLFILTIPTILLLFITMFTRSQWSTLTIDLKAIALHVSALRGRASIGVSLFILVGILNAFYIIKAGNVGSYLRVDIVLGYVVPMLVLARLYVWRFIIGVYILALSFLSVSRFVVESQIGVAWPSLYPGDALTIGASTGQLILLTSTTCIGLILAFSAIAVIGIGLIGVIWSIVAGVSFVTRSLAWAHGPKGIVLSIGFVIYIVGCVLQVIGAFARQ